MATFGFEDYIASLKVYLTRYREGSASGGDRSSKRDIVGAQIDPNALKRGSENIVQSSTNNVETSTPLEQRPSKLPRVESKDVDTSSLVRDPGLRQQIWDYPVSECDEIRRAYIKSGPYQPKAPNNQPFETDKNGRRFLDSWYKLFPDWLEYSPTKNRAFCLPCFLFTKPTGRPGSSAFTIEGFSSWKKVNKGKNCPLLSHMGKDPPNSSHRVAIKCCCDLTNQAQHIEAIIEKQTSIQIARNRLRLKTSIDVIKWLTFQACAFRGRDERHESNNRGNVIELIKLLASYNEDVAAVIQRFIREEINDGKFFILVDESEDESKREQMAIVLRFVDKYGFIKERFFDIVHMLDTTSATLKEEICIVLSRHNLSVQNISGQGYDGASNMYGEWTGLQALFCVECPFAYYVHCFAHRLQLALVGASKQVISINQFFSYLTQAINIVGSSCKRHDQLRAAQAADIAEKLAIDDEFETGKGKNQIGTLKRAGDTRWGSHLSSICSLINMFSATCAVLRNIINDGSKSNQQAEADGAYDSITSFEFVFILHLMRDIMEITDDLCQALQSKSQDILNAMHLVSTTKIFIQKFREDGWVPLLEKIKLFSNDHGIQIPDMSCPYKGGRVTRIKNRFKEDVMELLVLSSALDLGNGYRSFNIEDICKLADKFYPMDFSEQEKLHLKYQLENYKLDISTLLEF
ncbi:zinc finger MYM-type protein 1-like [Camellia sinensis]|uniref:zinc finger MYM-type protein 1-like n=1 Tax=Camellia sinensis TaxID=4442 RepID=UPI0010364569|nr:zinc finger MYM-type protein 1-like [Camellia sinensis]